MFREVRAAIVGQDWWGEAPGEAPVGVAPVARGAGRDLARAGRGRLVPRDREAPRSGPVDRIARRRGGRPAPAVSRLARTGDGPPARAPPEDREADRRAAASARRGAGTATAMVPAANQRTAGPRLSRGSGDACVARDDLSIAVGAGARGAAPGAHAVPADGARPAAPPRSRRGLWPAATHGADQRPTRRGRGPRRAGPLGRRPDPGEAGAVGDWHLGRTADPLRDARRPARGASRRTREGRAGGHDPCTP